MSMRYSYISMPSGLGCTAEGFLNWRLPEPAWDYWFVGLPLPYMVCTPLGTCGGGGWCSEKCVEYDSSECL